ncbi:ABC transporter ATP-binding protein [Salinarimonas soli]|uniref:ABC transporter ATP-binding protein n=1 Tax=Salinarimonas soli TaxID=1638099 RepID=A0A5B2VGK9_9HYPH|nr:ATP-binding cassette domain-containing protein [Salinarimonas soli]KAA2237479.1 ABC transporter ATP-binding protein [Salinarimonas soli]
MPGAGAPLLDLAVQAKVYRTADAAPVEAVRGLALALVRGETLCLIGPSGSGKTTTLRILLGLDRAFVGQVAPDPETLRIGIVFQEPRLLPWRSVEQNIRLALPRRERGRPLDDLLRDLGLTAWRNRFPGELSLGMARRVALARALAGEPDLLVLDEPFVSLDDRAAAELRAVVFAAAERRAAGVLMVTHNIREALDVADRIVLLTPRPARVLGEVAIDIPRAERTRAWAERLRGDLARRYPEAVAA